MHHPTDKMTHTTAFVTPVVPSMDTFVLIIYTRKVSILVRVVNCILFNTIAFNVHSLHLYIKTVNLLTFSPAPMAQMLYHRLMG